MSVATTAGAGATVAQFGFGTPWAAQLDFFRRKLSLPSERWDDIERGAHDRAFIVAGAAKADLLADLRAAVDSTMVSGGGLNEFRQKFRAVVAARGWTGWTGEGSAAGEAWRAKVIYQTNMASSYAAGRWQQMSEPSFAALRPFWKYVHADGQLYPRPLHQAWDGITLPKEHAFWKTHFAPNGWGCRCEIHPVAAPAAGAPTQPPAGWDTVDPKTGAPPGIDKGFNYAPGANVQTPLRQMVQDKLITYPPAISKALSRDVNRYIAADVPAEFAARMLVDRAQVAPLWLGFVEDAAALADAAGTDTTGFFVTLPGHTPRHVAASHAFDGKGQRPAAPADYALVTTVLNEADTLRAGAPSAHGAATVVAVKRLDGETFRAVFEVLTGKKNRALALLSLVIKTE